ncbi:DUF6894 family protein [Bosea caraganae]
MPRFYVDVSDGERAFVDRVGFEFTDEAEAREIARYALPDRSSECTAEDEHRHFTATVRDEAGRSIYSASRLGLGPPNLTLVNSRAEDAA